MDGGGVITRPESGPRDLVARSVSSPNSLIPS